MSEFQSLSLAGVRRPEPSQEIVTQAMLDQYNHVRERCREAGLIPTGILTSTALAVRCRRRIERMEARLARLNAETRLEESTRVDEPRYPVPRGAAPWNCTCGVQIFFSPNCEGGGLWVNSDGTRHATRCSGRRSSRADNY